MNNIEMVPSLDTLAKAPTLINGLSPNTARALLPTVAGLQALLEIQCHQLSTSEPASDEVLIDKDTVAHLIGMSVSWVEKHPGDLPLRRSVAGNPRWLKSEVLDWVKNRPRYGG